MFHHCDMHAQVPVLSWHYDITPTAWLQSTAPFKQPTNSCTCITTIFAWLPFLINLSTFDRDVAKSFTTVDSACSELRDCSSVCPE